MVKKIIAVIAVCLMLLAMVLYVASDDEAIPPVVDGPELGNPAGEPLPVPAAE